MPSANLQRNFAGEPSDSAFQPPQAGFPCVVANQRCQRIVGNHDLLGRQTGFLHLPRNQVLLRDLDLLLFGVAGEAQDLHTIEQRPRNRVESIRRSDEQSLRKIPRQVEIVIPERLVLLRIEDLEQRRRGIAAIIAPEFVDLVEHQNRVLRAGPPDRLNQSARHSADIRPPMSAQFRLVMHTAQADMRSNLRPSARAID